MTDYTITTNFGAKDSLPSGNAGKVIKGEEFTTEFTNIQTAVNTKADTAGDTFTGVVNFSDDVAVNTNTLFVDVSENRVGIGTTSPDALLHVDGGDVKISSDSDTSNGDGKPAILFTETTADQVDAAIVYNGDGVDADNNYLGIGVFDISLAAEDTLAEAKLATDLNITRDGKVGIGTTSPDGKLDVAGVIKAGDVGAASGGTALSVKYLTGHTLNNFGATYSSAETLIGFGVESHKSQANKFISTASNSNFTRGALTVGNDLKFFSAGAQTTAVGSEVTMTERMRIDSSGNVGIGTDSPTEELHLNRVASAGDICARIQNNTGTSGSTATLRFSVTPNSAFDSAFIGSDRFNALILGSNAAERARIDSLGNLLVGTTVSNPAGDNSVGVGISSGSYGGFIGVTRDGNTPVEINRKTSDGSLITLRRDGTTVGNIGTSYQSNTRYFHIGSTANSANTGIGFYDVGIYPSTSTGDFSLNNKNLGSSTVRWLTAYLAQQPNVSSDQRLKENIEDADDAGSTIDAIQVRKFDWIEDGRHQKYGMIAQELAEVYPEAVNVPENEEDTLGIATGDLIPMLIKEVQSLRSRVAELESR